jgi:phosphate transport system protein
MFEEKLANLKRELVEYAGLVEGMTEKAVKGLLEKRPDLFDEVVDQDEARANKYEVDIDEMGTALIAQHQPKARDLRTILMIMKMSNDLERMGDHAVNIAQSGRYLIERPLVKHFIDVPRMSKVTIGMLRDSIMAFINEDAALARNVCERDSEVDGLRDQLFRELITYMVEDSKAIERSLHLTRVAGNLERIADLSTNISEDVIFMVKGQVIKHHQADEESESP